MFSLLIVDLYDLSLPTPVKKMYVLLFSVLATYSVHDSRSKAKCPDSFFVWCPPTISTQKSFGTSAGG
jgi:hypothetical protein